eukprot:6434945-Alexandrium_andersonii.AAC.1
MSPPFDDLEMGDSCEVELEFGPAAIDDGGEPLVSSSGETLAPCLETETYSEEEAMHLSAYAQSYRE